jgi:hypothetical protein
MASTPPRLHSERSGRPRRLSSGDLNLLVFKRIASVRDRHCLFRGSLQPYKGLEPYETPARHHDAEAYLTERLRTSGLGYSVLHEDTPPNPGFFDLDLDLLLDLIELLHAEIVHSPIRLDPPEALEIEGFDQEEGRAIFRREMNQVLALAEPPLELLPIGHVVERSDAHRELYADPLPAGTESEVADPVEHALGLFLARGAGVEDKRAAVKQLADALEHLRPEVEEELLSKDEGDLFRIANQFAIRHNGPGQQRDYDKPVWLDWLFHVYLATIRAVVAVRGRPLPAGGKTAESVSRSEPAPSS